MLRAALVLLLAAYVYAAFDMPIQYTYSVPGGEEAAQVFADSRGHTLVGRVNPRRDDYIFERPNTEAERGLALPEGAVLQERQERKTGREAVDFEYPQDPNFETQWHLHGHAPLGYTAMVHIYATDPWENGHTGLGFISGIIDDGMDYTTDLGANFLPSHSLSVIGDSVMPSTGDTHGTQAAGLIAAARDDRCGVGVAYDSKLSVVRLLPKFFSPTDAEEARAFTHMVFDTNAPVGSKSNSWGPPDTGRIWGVMGPLASAAIADAFAHGYHGLGVSFIWASGNGREYRDQANFDQYCNNIATICVGAINTYGYASTYSEGGSCVFTSAPSSGGRYGIRTTTTGAQEQCTNRFTGTSAAAPQVAGVIALMRGANPRLSSRDVMHIIARTCSKEMTDGNPFHLANFESNSAGFTHDDYLGFGVINAARAVALSLNWTNVAPLHEYSATFPIVDSMRFINKTSSQAYAITIPVRDSLSVFTLEHVILDVDLSIRDEGMMRDITQLSLVSPAGTESRLLVGRNEHPHTSILWPFTSVKHWGEHPSGTWTVSITNGGQRQMRMNALRIRFTGMERVE